ncbi:MAG: hypothetical protein KGI54_07020 [Pseudomonadota bacterium]|nr:hypothetical protein [Pseudomonadota bacterium]
MSLYTSDSKTVVETKSYLGDFRDVLAAGETITSQSVTVTVFSGDDLNPSNLLYQGITVHAGWIEQRIRLGVPGNIYSINFIVGTSLGNTYDKVTRLAVLPEDGNAVPQFTNLYETSTLYPYILSDSFIANAPIISNGKLFGVVQAEDGFIASITIDTSVLTYQQYYYLYPLDGITASISIQNGLLISQSYLNYNDGPESISTGIAILNGTIVAATAVTYNIPYDAIQTSISIQNGTLT